jgi:hypothetical protein
VTKHCQNCNRPKGRHLKKEGGLWCPIYGGFLLEQYVERAIPLGPRTLQRCRFCGVGTIEIQEVYMVNDEIWVPFLDKEDFCCVGCLEEKLGRRLTPSDFRDVPLNEWTDSMSARLLDRMGVA